MTFELQAVVGVVVILLVLIGVQAVLVPGNQGASWGLGARDEEIPLGAIQGRAQRAVRNHIEGMMMFVPLVLVAHLIDLSTTLTVWGAGLFLGARALFVALYLAGVPVVRTLVWAVGTTGIVLIAYELILAMV